jgi:uncharacterized membrane protein YeaQ/YmgE (transglycosylase-associated protein family)
VATTVHCDERVDVAKAERFHRAVVVITGRVVVVVVIVIVAGWLAVSIVELVFETGKVNEVAVVGIGSIVTLTITQPFGWSTIDVAIEHFIVTTCPRARVVVIAFYVKTIGSIGTVRVIAVVQAVSVVIGSVDTVTRLGAFGGRLSAGDNHRQQERAAKKPQ